MCKVIGPVDSVAREVHVEEMAFELRHEKTPAIEETRRQQASKTSKGNKFKRNEFEVLEIMKSQCG